MAKVLRLETVRDVENILRTGGPSHRRDALVLLLKWRDQVGLRKTPHAQLRIHHLLNKLAPPATLSGAG